MAATNQSNSLAYRFFARESLDCVAAWRSSCLMMRSPTVSIARVVSALSRSFSLTWAAHREGEETAMPHQQQGCICPGQQPFPARS